LLADWQDFYREIFGIEIDIGNLSIPERKKDFKRLLVVAEGITPQKIYDKCLKFFSCCKWTNQNLDDIVFSERVAKKSYAVWVRDASEADEDLKNLSAVELKNIPGITLEERLLMELKYFKETGRHLDSENFLTLCSGSRYADGNVPKVFWFSGNGGLSVYWAKPEDSYVGLCSRRVIC